MSPRLKTGVCAAVSGTLSATATMIMHLPWLASGVLGLAIGVLFGHIATAWRRA